MICLSSICFTAYATSGDTPVVAPDLGGDTTGGNTTGGDTTGGGTTGSDTTGGDTTGGDTTGGDTTGGDTTGGDVTGDTTGDGTDYVDPNTQSGGYVDDTQEDEWYYYDEEQMANSIDNTAGNVSDYTDLYSTSGINEKELEKSEWSNIELNISDEEIDGAIDFSTIKTNKEDADDGQIYLYIGLTLIGISIIGILYFIIATATYKKKLKALKAREERQLKQAASRASYREQLREEFPTGDDYYRKANRKRYATGSTLGYAEKKRLKAETAQIPDLRNY